MGGGVWRWGWCLFTLKQMTRQFSSWTAHPHPPAAPTISSAVLKGYTKMARGLSLRLRSQLWLKGIQLGALSKFILFSPG